MTEHVSILTHGAFFLGEQIAQNFSARSLQNEASRLAGECRAGRFRLGLCPRL